MLYLEDYYNKLMKAHCESSHGGRDRMYNHYEQKGWMISRHACQLFESRCVACNRKRAPARSGIVVKPITT